MIKGETDRVREDREKDTKEAVISASMEWKRRQ